MIDNNSFSPLDKKYLKLLFIYRGFAFILIVSAVILFFVLNKDLPISFFVKIIIISIVVALMAFNLALTRLVYNKKCYVFNSKLISFRKGVIVHSTTLVPYSRIQHIEIDEGPLERFFKLSTLSIYTAGDNGKDLKINGLNKERAKEIKEYITNILSNEGI